MVDIRRMLAIVCGVACAGDPSGQAGCPLCRLVISEYKRPRDPRHEEKSQVVECLRAARMLASTHTGTRSYAIRKYSVNMRCKKDHMVPG